MEGSGQLLSFFCLGILKGKREKCIEPFRCLMNAEGRKLCKNVPFRAEGVS